MESTFAPCGKLKDIGTSTSTSSSSRSPSVPPSFARRSARRVRERSTRMGSTMKRLDVTNAVRSASCASAIVRLWLTGVSAATSPGSSQKVSRQAKTA